MADKKHIYYFDWLRVVAMFGVIAIHAVGYMSKIEIGVEWGLVNLVLTFVYTSVPLFLMISGYLAFSDERTADVSVVVKKRIPKVLLPLIGWSLVAIVLNCLLVDNLTVSSVLDGIKGALSYRAWPHLWYLYTLLAITVISPIIYNGIKHLNRSGHIFVLVLIAIVSLRSILCALLPSSVDEWLNIDIINKLELFSGHLCTFILGYYLGAMEKKIPNWILWVAFVVVFGIVFGGAFITYWKNGAVDGGFRDQSAGFEILLAAIVFLLFKQSVAKPSKILKSIPVVPLSFGIYLCHDIVLAFLRRWFPMESFVGSIVWVVMTFVVSYILMKTVATIKPICYIATGMTYKQACDSCNWVYTFRKLTKKA